MAGNIPENAAGFMFFLTGIPLDARSLGDIRGVIGVVARIGDYAFIEFLQLGFV